MPSSRPAHIPIVVNMVRQLKPASILDIGVGFGKWGHLFREYTDILASEHDPARYHRENWKVRIDGIEGFPSYITAMHRYIYDEIIIGDMCELAAGLSSYDLIFMGDVIEHVEKEAGLRLLRHLYEKASKAVIVSTPSKETHQVENCDNELERHRSLWTRSDFKVFDRYKAKVVSDEILLAVGARPGIAIPKFTERSRSRINLLKSRVRRLGRAWLGKMQI